MVKRYFVISFVLSLILLFNVLGSCSTEVNVIPTMTCETVNGSTLCGYWVDVNGEQVFKECDPNGAPNDEWVSIPYTHDNPDSKLRTYLVSEAWADPAMTYATVNGTTLYGYWIDANGKQVFVECDQNGTPIKGWVNNGSFVTKTRQVLDGYTTQQDMSKTTYVFSPECWFGPLWKGTINLAPAWSFYGSVTPMKVASPYGSLPETWRWVVSEYDNENPFPVMTDVIQSLGSGGESYSGQKYFGPGEQKFLLLKLNSSLPVSTGGMLGTCAYVNINYDPQAPTTPVNYVNNPPADDGTGTVWTAHLYQGISISNYTQSNHYANGGIWGLVPCFKEIPVWNPEPGDPYWGTLSFQSVPAWEWTVVGGCGYTTSNPYYEAYVPNTPYIVPGFYGSPVIDPSQISGPYDTCYVWNRKDYTHTYWSAWGTVSTDWASYVNQNWPNFVNISGNISYAYNSSGYFYTDASKSCIIKWYWGNGSVVRWSAYDGQNWTSGITYNTDPYSVPNDGQDHLYWDSSNSCYSVVNETQQYAPIYGSYEQIQAVSRSKSWPYYPTDCTVQHHAVVYNPSDQALQFIMTKGLQNGDTYYNDYCTIPGAAQGWVTLQPHSYTELTSTYSLPQSTYDFYGGIVPREWFTDLSYAHHPVADDFVPGSCRPVNRMYEWQITGIQSNMVGYDWGEYVISGGGYFMDESPGLNGGYIDMERDMTPIEMNSYLSRASYGSYVIDSTAALKARAIMANGGTTTWGMKSVLYYKNHDGWYPYTSLVP